MRRQLVTFVLVAAVLVSMESVAFAQSGNAGIRTYLDKEAPRLTQTVQPQTVKKEPWARKNPTLVGAIVGAGLGALVGYAGGKGDQLVATRQYAGLGLGLGAVTGLIAGVLAK